MPLRDGGLWHQLIARGRVRIELPRLQREPTAHHGFGRPRVQDSLPELGALVWYHDICQDGYKTIAKALGYRGQDPRTTVRHRIKQGRSHLHTLGVIPWAAWPDGDLATDWWSTPELEHLVQRWITDTLTAQSPARNLVKNLNSTSVIAPQASAHRSPRHG